MPIINPNFEKLVQNYLFSEVGARRVKFEKGNPGVKVYNLGIGDVTLPLPPSIVEAGKSAMDEQLKKETFRGYPDAAGYPFLREAIAAWYRGLFDDSLCPATDEVFVGSGAKDDLYAIQQGLFAQENSVAIVEPAYPAYIDANVLAGRKDHIRFLPTTEATGFVPEIPKEKVDLIYLCYPNNPTGAMISKSELQKWVDYANKNNSIILYDAVYSEFISDPDLPRSIYACDGAKKCAIEMQSFSKRAGFTGMRCGWTIVPQDTGLRDKWKRYRDATYNGTSYPIQRMAEAALSERGKREIAENLAYYAENASIIRRGLTGAGLRVFGGVNSPYCWVKIPGKMTSWDFFDLMLERANVVGTPGSGFGKSGEGYFRLTSFNTHENTAQAVANMKKVLS